jgi:Fe-S-cluster containining protein
MVLSLFKEEKDNKWYKNGLRFKCTECGKCCTGKPGYVWVSEEEIMNIALSLKMPVDLFMRKYVRKVMDSYSLIEKSQNYDCIFLEGKKCQIYQNRPQQCRTFPWWPENLESLESWQETAKDCEGINDEAPLVSFAEIEKAKG